MSKLNLKLFFAGEKVIYIKEGKVREYQWVTQYFSLFVWCGSGKKGCKMPKKKRMAKKPETQVYMIDVVDWSVDYAFVGLERISLYGPRKHCEDASLTIYGEVTYPKYKNVSKAQVYLTAEPGMNDHWKNDYDGERSSTVGYIQILRDKITLHLMADIPSRMYTNLQISLAAGKIKFIQAYGERLKWGRGCMHNISFSTKKEEED